MKKLILLLISSLFLGACAKMEISDFQDQEPKLDLFQYFEGETEAFGIFENRSGAVKRTFLVEIMGTIEGDLLTLNEQFYYSDGERDERIWKIRKVADGRFEGQAGDVIGTALGVSAGNALNWNYVLDLPVGDTSYHVEFDDWMFLQPKGFLLNIANVSKWGFNVGRVTLSFQKKPQASL